MNKKEEIISFLKGFMDKALPSTPGEEYLEIPFLEMGANSLILMQVQQAIENKYKLTIEIPMFFEELTNMAALVDYIEANSAVEQNIGLSPAIEASSTIEQNPENEQTSKAVPSLKTAPKPQIELIGNPVTNQPNNSYFTQPVFTQPASLHSQPIIHTGDLSFIDTVFTQQMQAASQTITNLVAQQLQFLGEMGIAGEFPKTTAASPDLPEKSITSEQQLSSSTLSKPSASEAETTSPPLASAASTSAPKKTSSSALMHKMLSPLEIRARGLTPQQKEHLEALITVYTKRTPKSKELTAKYRPVLADSRAAVGFRFTTKEMLYPIIGKYGKGARVWDIDGNEYIDITMGQGVILFGHDPQFISDALKNSEAERLLGPRPYEAGEAAQLICEFTGMDRVTFTNSGTEAVMAAVRLARAATQRNKLVMFENAYHGHSDNVMGRAVWQDNILKTAPVAPGITQGAVDDLWLLEYDTKEALDFIKKNAKEIAAVIVEPVQSRRPDLQPREFLHELRKITSETGIVFIFDEMITGFRVHPGGAQAVFGVQADIATYGKVLGGGMPIGVVAGKSKFMDAIDGGMWQYNDASYPKVNRTVFGGTFCQHPTAMITTLAALRHLKAQGPALQNELNRKTKAMADELNAFFDAEEVPIKVVYFGSLFRFAFSTNLELLFYHLMVKGVFIWEWRNYFLCTAHTDADIAHIIKSVKESVMEMRRGGFLPEKSGALSAVSPSEKSGLAFGNLTSEKSSLAGEKNLITAEASDKKKSELSSYRLTPLTKAQHQLAVLAQIAPEGSKAYHVSPLLSIKGELDKDALQSAVIQLLERHESLRSIIDGNYLKVLSVEELANKGSINLVDLTNPLDFTKSNEQAAEFSAEKEWLSAYACKEFDLQKGPLFEVNLLKISDKDWRLVFKGHHIIIDGMSMNIVMQELASFYNSKIRNYNNTEKTDITSAVLSSPLSWHEYAEWQNSSSVEREAFLAKQEKYWLNQLQGELPIIQLPCDYLEPAVKSYKGGRHTKMIPKPLAQSLYALGRASGCTDFMVLFAAYALWLHRLSGQDDILIGMPVAGRTMPKRKESAGGDSLVGYCTHLVPIRSRISWEQTFTQYLKALRTVLLYGYQNQDYPFAELMERLNLKRDGQRSPLVSVLFNLDRPGAPPAMDGLSIEWLSQPVYYTAFDLTLNLTQVDTKLVLECDFNCDRFERETVERYVNNFITLLKGIAKTPEANVAAISLLTDKEKKQILIDWNATYADYPSDKCMHQLFEEQAKNNPEAAALRFVDSISPDSIDSTGMCENVSSFTMNYKELNQISNIIAHGLIELGTKTEDVVGIYMHHSPELVASFLGVLKAGAAYLPLDPSYPKQRLAFMLKDAGAKILLTHAPLLSSLPETEGVKTIALDAKAAAFIGNDSENPKVEVTPQNLAYLIYTSGSTGLPKGTMIIHKGFVNYLTWASKYYCVAEGEGSPLHSSIGFDATITSIFTPLISGRTLWLFNHDDNGYALSGTTNNDTGRDFHINFHINNDKNKTIDDKSNASNRTNSVQPVSHQGQELENIHSALMSGTNWSLMKFTPAHLELINAMVPEDKFSGSTRCLIFGGEALLGRQVAPWRKNAPKTRLINEYGPTETVVGCCIYEVEEINPEPGSLPIGKPIDNTRLYILDANKQPVPIGVTGELYIGGDGVARGYLGRDDLNAERFVPVSSTGLDGEITIGDDEIEETGGSVRITVPQERLYRTGDLVRYRPDGVILYFGRMDNQIKIRGYRVELGEVENALVRLSGIKEAVVVAHKRSEQDVRLIAWVVLDNFARDSEYLDEIRIKNLLSAQLPTHMVPSSVVILDALPLTVNGKVDRAALPLPENLRSDFGKVFVTPRTEAEERIAAIWREVLSVKRVGMDDNFFEIGGHSLLILPLREKLQAAFGCSLSPVDIFRYHTVAAQAAFLTNSGKDGKDKTFNAEIQTINNVKGWQQPKISYDIEKREPIAIVGMAVRVPGADNLDKFWENLINGVESITLFSDEELRKSGVSESLLNNPEYVKRGFPLINADKFDAGFFEMTPREAEVLDPQHRHLMECSWEALEHAGYDPKRYDGRIGIFGGVGLNTYLINNIIGHNELLETLGPWHLTLHNDKDFAPTRVAYKLDLRGPALSINTACSSSLVAVAMGCQSLLNHQTDMILAGGCTINLPQDEGYLYHQGSILSSDGHCRPFDINANGTIDGNGAAVVVLKRLSDAVKDGDTVHAVISGFAVNNDGSLKVGYTAPSIEGQAEVILQAQNMAGVSSDNISFVEAHGTGTDLGDAVEIAALTQAFRQNIKTKNSGQIKSSGQPLVSKFNSKDTSFCAIGSVKANIGHLDTAAGVASLIKTVLSLRNNVIPPMPSFTEPNPKLELETSPFFINSKLIPWESNSSETADNTNWHNTTVRRAGISSFGQGGTNVHVIVEEPPEHIRVNKVHITQAENRDRPRNAQAEHSQNWAMLTLTARTPEALEKSSLNLSQFLEKTTIDLEDAAFTLQTGRRHFNERCAVLTNNYENTISMLSGRKPSVEVSSNSTYRQIFRGTAPSRPSPVVFLFPGQDMQHDDMACGLYYSEPVFRTEVNRCADILRSTYFPALPLDWYPSASDKETLTSDRATDPVPLFVIEYALARMWQSLGVQPQAMLGYSLGEYTAACVSGVLSLEDALHVAVAGGRLLSVLKPGLMLGVSMAEEDLLPLLGSELDIAMISTPNQCVIGGSDKAVEGLEITLNKKKVGYTRLPLSYAFHTRLMEPFMKPFRAELKKVKFNPPTIPYISSVTGRWIEAEEAMDPEHYVALSRQCIRLADGFSSLIKSHANAMWLEVGPGQGLASLAMQQPGRPSGHTVISTLHDPRYRLSKYESDINKLKSDSIKQKLHDKNNIGSIHDDTPALFAAIARLWTAGIDINWSARYSSTADDFNVKRRRIPLPAYPFEHQSYWIAPVSKTRSSADELVQSKGNGKEREHQYNGDGKLSNPADWFYVPVWRESPLVRTFDNSNNSHDLSDTTNNETCRDFHINSYTSYKAEKSGQSSAIEQTNQIKGVWLVIGDRFGIADELIKSGADVITKTEKFDCNNDSIDWSSLIGWDNIFNELESLNKFPDHIIYLGLLGNRNSEWLKAGFHSIVALGQSLSKRAFTENLSLTVISSGVLSVIGDEREMLEPAKAAVIGPLKVIPQEYSNILCRLIDVDSPDALPYNNNFRRLQWLSLIKTEILETQMIGTKIGGTEVGGIGIGGIEIGGTGIGGKKIVSSEISGRKGTERIVAYRGTKRWVETFEQYPLLNPVFSAQPYELAANNTEIDNAKHVNEDIEDIIDNAKHVNKNIKLSDSGVYLITGGLGNIGMALAETIFKNAPKAVVVLTGRRSFANSNQSRIQKFNTLQSKGFSIKYGCADATDIQQMTILIDEIESSYGQLRGVIHAAGLVGEESFATVSETTEQFSIAQIRPKLEGSKVLEKVLGDRNLDFCILCSSLSPILGGLGFSAYAAANASLDAFVAAHNQRYSTQWLCVNWEGWRFDETVVQGQAGASVAELGLTSDEGCDAFERLLPLSGFISRIVLSTGHLDSRIQKWVNLEKSSAKIEEPLARHARPALLCRYEPPYSEVQKKLTGLWEQLLGIDGIGVKDSFFELGGNSLLMTQLIMHIRKAFRLELSLAELFETPTIADIAAQIEERQKGLSSYEEREDGII